MEKFIPSTATFSVSRRVRRIKKGTFSQVLVEVMSFNKNLKLCVESLRDFTTTIKNAH